MEKFTFFWRVSEPFGFLSQWYHSDFIINGVQYNCAEQYMMAEKARMFHDLENLEKIMSVRDARLQKEFGRNVSNFEKTTWDKVARSIVYSGNRAKFTQIEPTLRMQFLNTAGTTLVEASPKDTIWGIGLLATDPRAQSRETWLGTNWLGETLTELRNNLGQFQ